MSHKPSRMRRLLRLGLRVLVVLLVVLLGTPMLDAVWPLPGLIAPPALITRHRGELDAQYVHDEFPPHTERVELPAGDGHVLRGVFVPSDPGAPVVLHLLGSGASLLDGRLRRPVYEDLADRGFASLVVDWNGVGASSGPGHVDLLRRDAQVMWREALARAGGPERVVVRAISLGGLAAAMLLEGGARPGALVLVAPVRAETVTSHWTRFFFGGLADWLSAPWLTPLADVDILAVLADTDVPVLALSTPSDVLLPADEQRLLAETLAISGGRLVYDPERHSEIRGLRIFGLMGRHMTRAESSHFVQAVQARALFEPELTVLEAVLPEWPRQRRLAAWYARRPLDAPALTTELEVAVGRLLLHGGASLDAGLEAALATPDPAQALQLLRLAVDGQARWLRVVDGEPLRALLDLSDPAGSLRVQSIRDAWRFLTWGEDEPGVDDDGAAPSWSVDQLLSCFQYVTPFPDYPQGWPLERDDLGMDPHDRVRLAGIARGTWIEGLHLTADAADARRYAVRALLKVLGVPERLVPGRDEDRWIEMFVDGCWVLVDLDQQLPHLAAERVVGSTDWESVMVGRVERPEGADEGEIEYPPPWSSWRAGL